MGHWHPKTEITRDAESDLPIQAIVGRTAKKPTAVYQQDLPDMTGQITRSNDYVAVPKTAPVTMVAAPPAPPQTELTPTPTAPVMPAQQTVQNHQQSTGQAMSNDHNQPCHQHPVQAYPAQNWYGGQPQAYAPQPLVVQQLPMPGHNVQTDRAPDVTYRKGILGIGSEAFDLTGEMLDSFEFKAKFILFLTQVLAQDLNVQAALFTPNEKKQDGEIAALAAADKVLKHAIQCAYYEDGDIVFPGLKNDCGKDARVKVPPVNGIKYDLKTSTLAIGSAELVLPVAVMVSNVITTALNAAATALPKLKKAEDITDVPVFDRDDQCAPAKSATIAQFAEAVMTNGLTELCENGKLVDIEKPSKLLAFGAKCKEIGFTTIESLLRQLNKSLPLAPKGNVPKELRGFALADGTGESEQRYPVVVTQKRPISASGSLVASGESTAGLVGPSITVVAPADDYYLVTGGCVGYIKVDTDAKINEDNVDMRLVLSGGVNAQHADHGHYTVGGQQFSHVMTISDIVFLKAGATVMLNCNYFGGGLIGPGSIPMSGGVTLTPLGTTSLAINPA